MDSPVASVSFFYASVRDVILSAFNAAGIRLVTVTRPANIQPAGFTLWDLIGVSVAENIITRVILTGGRFNAAIDDFENCELVTPEERIDLLIGDVQDLVESGVLDSGNASALLATLDQGLTAMTADRPSAVNLLNAFINQVEGFIAGGILTPEEGQALIDAAQFAIDQLNA